jgi:hypothetical protein
VRLAPPATPTRAAVSNPESEKGSRRILVNFICRLLKNDFFKNVVVE